MLTWIKKIFTKPTLGTVLPANNSSSPEEFSALRPDGFQSATLSDTQFIFDSILEEASCGHFNSEYLLPRSRDGLIHQIESSITQGKCLTHSNAQLESKIYVFLDSNYPVGFSWVLEKNKTEKKELYLLAVMPKHRRTGIGNILVSETISRFPSKTKFTARVYLKSDNILKILIKIGFKRAMKLGKSTIIRLSYVSK